VSAAPVGHPHYRAAASSRGKRRASHPSRSQPTVPYRRPCTDRRRLARGARNPDGLTDRKNSAPLAAVRSTGTSSRTRSRLNSRHRPQEHIAREERARVTAATLSRVHIRRQVLHVDAPLPHPHRQPSCSSRRGTGAASTEPDRPRTHPGAPSSSSGGSPDPSIAARSGSRSGPALEDLGP